MTETPTYDLAFFRHLFEGTTEEQWCALMRRSCYPTCALGMCDIVDGENPRYSNGPAACALATLFKPLIPEDHYEPMGFRTVCDVNNGYDPRYRQVTPRARILAAIADLERMAAAPEPTL